MTQLTLDERVLDAMTDNQVAECLEYCFYSYAVIPFLKGLIGKNRLTEFEVGQFTRGLVGRDENAAPIANGYSSAKERQDTVIMGKVQKATCSTLSLFHQNWETVSTQRYFEDCFSHFLVFIKDVEATDCRDALQRICIEKKPNGRTAFGLLYTSAELCELARDGDVKFWTEVYDGKPETRFLGKGAKIPAALALLYIHEPSLAQRFPDFAEHCTHLGDESHCAVPLAGLLNRYLKTFPELYPERLDIARSTINDKPFKTYFEDLLRRLNQSP